MTARARGRRTGALIIAAGGGAALAVTAHALLAAGDGPDGLRLALRQTARTSLVPLLLAFVASSAVALWRSGWAKWLLRYRKHLGLAFAASHFVHGVLILAFAFGYPDTFAQYAQITTVAGGSVGYAFAIAMTITSFEGPKRRMGRRRWKQLHTAGMWVLFGIFAFSYAGRVALDPLYVVPAVAVAAALGVRVAAMIKRRTSGRAHRRA